MVGLCPGWRNPRSAPYIRCSTLSVLEMTSPQTKNAPMNSGHLEVKSLFEFTCRVEQPGFATCGHPIGSLGVAPGTKHRRCRVCVDASYLQPRKSWLTASGCTCHVRCRWTMNPCLQARSSSRMECCAEGLEIRPQSRIVCGLRSRF